MPAIQVLTLIITDSCILAPTAEHRGALTVK